MSEHPKQTLLSYGAKGEDL